MRLFARPASEARAIEQGVALLMDSYDRLPPHDAQLDKDEPGVCYVMVLQPNDSWFGVLRHLRMLIRDASARRSKAVEQSTPKVA